MERETMLKQINDIFIDVLDNKEIRLTEAIKAVDIEEWDSFTHIQLVVAIEKHFEIHFTSKEIQNWRNVGEMMDCIQAKE